jgi:salicylate hydroxylase
MNAVAITRGTADADNWSSKGEAFDLKPQFADWAEEPFELLQQFENWKCWPLLEMTPLPQWSDGCVTLLGDAAHPIMPFLASGAVMAIEDAAILAAEFVRAPGDPAKAFRTYEARRRGRLARVRRGAAQMGAVYHMSGVMRFARNATLSVATGERLLARNDWLYGYCAEF